MKVTDVFNDNPEVLKIISSHLHKNKLEARVCVIDSGDYSGGDVSEFINCSEYVIRLDYGKSMATQKLGFKTDILYIDRFNFAPFELNKMKNNFLNFLYKSIFNDSTEIWLPVHLFLMNEWLLGSEEFKNKQPEISGSLIKRSWNSEIGRSILNEYIKHLYMHNKMNIKMLSFKEFDLLLESVGSDFDNYSPSPLAYALEMVKKDSRFRYYEIFVFNRLKCNEKTRVKLPLEKSKYDLNLISDLEKEYHYISNHSNTCIVDNDIN